MTRPLLQLLGEFDCDLMGVTNSSYLLGCLANSDVFLMNVELTIFFTLTMHIGSSFFHLNLSKELLTFLRVQVHHCRSFPFVTCILLEP